MPNWCENDLTVSGSKEAVEEFLKFAAGESPFDFNRFIRYPEEYRRLDELAKAWDREHEGRPDYDWCARPKDGFNSGGYEWRVANWGTKWPAFHVDVEEPVTGCDEGAREVVFHVDTPSSPPTPVIVEKPVTSDDEKTLEVVFHFDTAWSPPTPVIEKAAQLYPALRFELRYFECGMGFNGLFCCSGGEVESDESGRYFGNRGG